MAGFRKAHAEQAALKIGVYGPPGSGKTFTSLLMAEGLAKHTRKRVAYVDTERGTDFYCKPAPRKVHPEAFDFDAIYTKSITEVLSAVKALKYDEHSVLVIDSITHIWEACRAAYVGKTTKIGTIPMHAWGQIKKPYKELMAALLSSPIHVIFCGRQGTEYGEDESGELKSIGVKMKAEGETPYEPHILIRMEAVKSKKSSEMAEIRAFAEKDRTGVLAGKTIVNPNFDSLCAPLLQLLGDKQAVVETEEEVGAADAEALDKTERSKEQHSGELLNEYVAKISLAKTKTDLSALGKLITPELKKGMLTPHVNTLREKYQQREHEITNGVRYEPDHAA